MSDPTTGDPGQSVDRQRDLARLRDELETVLDSVPTVIFFKDLDNKISRCNRAAAAYVGLEIDEISGTSMVELFPEESSRILSEDKKIIESKKPMIGILDEITFPSGETRVCVTDKVPLFDAQGRVDGIAVFSVDVSDLTRARAQAERAARDLEAANRELQASLDRANRLVLEAASANRAKSRFLADMSHEIRTPLGGIVGVASLLDDNALPQEQREYAAMIRASGQTLLEVVNAVLDISKIEAGMLGLEDLDFDLRSTLRESLEVLEIQTRLKGVAMSREVDDDVPDELRGDPGRLRQILLNLVGNAVKFTEQGSIAVRVSLDGARSKTVRLRFEVRDTGPGIPLDQQQRIFDAFAQGSPSTPRRHGGTGLGLAISGSLVEMMRGEIGLDSAPGQGARFWFTAVLGRTHAARSTAPAPPAPGLVAPPTHAPSGLWVLVVEDNATNRIVTERMLTKLGHHCRSVTNGAEAIETLAQRRFDLVLMDVQMPVMDGLEATRRIRAPGSTALDRRVPIVALTAHALRGDRERCLEAGMDEYLAKPVAIDALADVIDAAIGEMWHNKGG